MKALLWFAVAAACNSDRVALPLVAPGQPALVAHASGYGPWHALEGRFDGAATTYQLDLDGDYALALVCVDPDGTFHAAEVFGTLDDAEVTVGSWQLPDCRPRMDAGSDGGPAVEVEAQVVDASHVALDSGPARIANALPWALETSVAPGTHDVILWGDTAMRIVRGLPFVASRNELGVLAVAEASSPFIVRPYEVPVIGDEMATTAFTLTTANGTVMQYSASPDTAYFPSADALTAGDTERFEIVVTGVTTERRAVLSDFAETPPDVDLLPQVSLPSLAANAVRAHWTPFAAFFTSATIEYADQAGSQSASASKLWLERHAGADIAFDEVDVPHYDPSWHVTAPNVKFTVERWSPGVTLFTTTPRIF